MKLKLNIFSATTLSTSIDEFDLVVHEKGYVFENSLLTRLYLNFDDPAAHDY